jgi:hypothetical protein
MEKEPTSDIQISNLKIDLPVFTSYWKENLSEIKESILNLRKEFPETVDDGNIECEWRSDWMIHKRDEFAKVKEYIETLCNNISGQHLECFDIFEVTNMWAMIYGKEDGAKAHHHFPSTFSVCFYISVGDDPSPICFFPNTCQQPEDGMILVFPSNAVHYVPHIGTSERICISANLKHVPRQLAQVSEL